MRLKQTISETRENVHALLGVVLRMARNLHNGFHEILKPRPEPLKALADRKARMAVHAKGRA